MSNEIIIKIPQVLRHAYFHENKEEMTLDSTQTERWTVQGAYDFRYECLEAAQIPCFAPWNDIENVFPDMKEYWREIQEQLDECYQQRDTKKAAPFMKQGISMCFTLLFWINEKPAILHEWSKAVEELAFVPVNFSERIQFVLARPNLYQSFKVLEQMMSELEKLMVRSQIMKKRTRK